MPRRRKKKTEPAHATLRELLDQHLVAVINTLLDENLLEADKTAFDMITNASRKFIKGVSAELLETPLTPLQNLINPGRYNSAIKERREANAADKMEALREPQDERPPQYDIPPSVSEVVGGADLFGD